MYNERNELCVCVSMCFVNWKIIAAMRVQAHHQTIFELYHSFALFAMAAFESKLEEKMKNHQNKIQILRKQILQSYWLFSLFESGQRWVKQRWERKKIWFTFASKFSKQIEDDVHVSNDTQFQANFSHYLHTNMYASRNAMWRNAGIDEARWNK